MTNPKEGADKQVDLLFKLAFKTFKSSPDRNSQRIQKLIRAKCEHAVADAAVAAALVELGKRK